MSSTACGLHAARLNLADYAVNFGDAHPNLTRSQALIEAERCYYCYDAPCQTACPTGIDIPSFIQRIAQDNNRGAAKTILESNPLGGMCARVCPTEVLCEQACVRNTNEDKSVEIGALQRYATDAYFDKPGAPLFTRATSSGFRVAVVGAGPAGLACAHGLARRGHAVELFDAHDKLGGLNEYGLATYKTAGDFAQKEIAWLLSIGGITVHSGKALGKDISLDGLLKSHDAVFLGLGLQGVNALGVAAPDLPSIRDAVDFIAELRQSDPAKVKVGKQVVVIGGGMTAVDAAVQSRLLGAEQVTMVYRRGVEAMSASTVEQEWALKHGVTIRHWAAPKEVSANSVRFTNTQTGEEFTLECDMLLKAIGQTFITEPIGSSIKLDKGRIVTDADGKTSHTKVWAGGDCRVGGKDLTVEAVEHGKVAAVSIDKTLRG